MQIKIETPGDEAYGELHERLVRLNREKAAWTPSPFTVVVYSDEAVLIGGARAIVNMGLAEIRGLWVEPPYRMSGLGGRIMAAVERHAHSLGATCAALHTYDWQARGFYEKLGYTVFGTLAYPGGAQRYHMRKDLSAEP